MARFPESGPPEWRPPSAPSWHEPERPTFPTPRITGPEPHHPAGEHWGSGPAPGPEMRPSGQIPPQRAWEPQEVDPATWGSMPHGQPPRRSNTTLWVVLGVVLALLVVGGGVGFFLWQRSHSAPKPTAASSVTQHAASSAATSAAASSAPAPAAPNPATMTEQQALNYLAQLRAESLKRVQLDGRWVAQVASKSVGITDPLQTALNGSHTFMARDILAESLAADKTVDSPTKVYVLWGTDFGKKSQGPNGLPYWITLVDAGYASHDNVLAWCKTTYPTLTPQQLADTCAPRQLTPPQG